MPCPYSVILGRDTALPSPLSCPRVQLELICLAETGIPKKAAPLVAEPPSQRMKNQNLTHSTLY